MPSLHCHLFIISSFILSLPGAGSAARRYACDPRRAAVTAPQLRRQEGAAEFREGFSVRPFLCMLCEHRPLSVRACARQRKRVPRVTGDSSACESRARPREPARRARRHSRCTRAARPRAAHGSASARARAPASRQSPHRGHGAARRRAIGVSVRIRRARAERLLLPPRARHAPPHPSPCPALTGLCSRVSGALYIAVLSPSPPSSRSPPSSSSSCPPTSRSFPLSSPSAPSPSSPPSSPSPRPPMLRPPRPRRRRALARRSPPRRLHMQTGACAIGLPGW